MEAHPEIDFQHLADSPAFAEFSVIVHELTGIHLSLYSPDFSQTRTRFPFSHQSPLCLLIGASEEGMAECMRCNQRHFEAVTRMRRGMAYLCHAGLIDMAIPIFHRRRLVAVISCGQIRPCPGDDGFEVARELIARLGLCPEEAREAYRQTSHLDERRIDVMMKLIAFFAEHLCEVGQQLIDLADGSVRDEIVEAMRYVRDNLDGELSRSTVAAHVSLSPPYFSDLFHRTTGVSFTDHVQQARVERAARLLEQTPRAITQIAFDCGFNSISQFNRVFRKLQGCTPREYRTMEDRLQTVSKIERNAQFWRTKRVV